MLPGLILVGFLEGLLPKPWNAIGVGLVAAFWALSLVLGVAWQSVIAMPWPVLRRWRS